MIIDTIVFLAEKGVASWAFRGLIARQQGSERWIIAYLQAAARESCSMEVLSLPARDGGRWERRVKRFLAADAYRVGDFRTAISLTLEAVSGEEFAPFACEYLAFAAAAAYEAHDLQLAMQLADKAATLWTSRLARILEPRVGSVAHYLKWVSLREQGLAAEGLASLAAAAELQTDRALRCGQWTELLREAHRLNDPLFSALALRCAQRYCAPDDV